MIHGSINLSTMGYPEKFKRDVRVIRKMQETLSINTIKVRRVQDYDIEPTWKKAIIVFRGRTILYYWLIKDYVEYFSGWIGTNNEKYINIEEGLTSEFFKLEKILENIEDRRKLLMTLDFLLKNTETQKGKVIDLNKKRRKNEKVLSKSNVAGG